MKKFRRFALAVIVSTVIPVAGFAMGSDWSGGSTTETAKERAGAAVKAGNYLKAVDLLKPVIENDPRDADAQNMLGFAHRKLGDLSKALIHYQAALAIEPLHRGANEYLGELYLEQGDLVRAEQQLAALRRACPGGCEEADELTAAIAEVRRRAGTRP